VKQLYLIRHCETKTLAGEEPPHPRDDSELTERGRRQADRLSVHLREKPIDLLLTSLFKRARQTADILNRERNVPVFSALALNEYFLRDDFQGAETIDQALSRSLGFLNQFRPFYEHIAVVGHNSILSTILMSLLNLHFDAGKDAFRAAGTCRVLRYDWKRGDQNWREVESFIP
jgi:broad specificity phosphatase PhoE